MRADIRQPEAILDAPEVQDLIDFTQPVAVLMISVLHFVSDEENPAGIIAAFRDRIALGSHLAVSHTSSHSDPEAIKQLAAATAGTPAMSTFRSREEIQRLLIGLEILPPGVVTVQRWRPDQDAPSTLLDVQAAVARKN